MNAMLQSEVWGSANIDGSGRMCHVAASLSGGIMWVEPYVYRWLEE